MMYLARCLRCDEAVGPTWFKTTRDRWATKHAMSTGHAVERWEERGAS